MVRMLPVEFLVTLLIKGSVGCTRVMWILLIFFVDGERILEFYIEVV